MRLFTYMLAAVVLLAFVPTLSAQTLDLLVDDYEDGDNSEYFAFAGGEFPALSSTGMTPDGSAFALQVDIDGDDYGNFAGFGRGVPMAPYNTSGLINPYLVLDLSANVPMTVEINLQTDGTTESRNALVLDGNGSYTTYALPFSSFFQSQPNPFDPTMLNNIVFAVINLAGDGDSNTMEATLRIDNLAIFEGATASLINDIDIDTFEDGDNSEYFIFAGGEVPTLSSTTSTPDGSMFALHGEIDADEYMGFAGFGRTLGGAPVDASSATHLNFFLRTNASGVLEVNLQNDPAAPSGPQESREAVQVMDTGGAYRLFSLPIDAFIQTTAVPFDPSAAFNVVLVFVQLTGDGDPNTTEFTFDIDRIGFSTSELVPVELTAFEATLDGDVALLTWATASETNNAGFAVEHRTPGTTDWTEVAFVTGAGTTTEAQTYSHTVSGLDVGTHTFRLKQVDFDGAFEYSQQVEVAVGVPGSHTLSQVYPNPFNPQAQFSVAVASTQQVRAELYDALGRRVATLFEGTLEANASQAIRIDGAGLATGSYVVRVMGETFAESRRVSLLR